MTPDVAGAAGATRGRVGGGPAAGAIDGDPYERPGYFGPPVSLDPEPATPGLVFALFAAHGGCGSSTVAVLLDPDGIGWAVEIGPQDLVSREWVPVVVARSTAYGTASACDLVARWPAQIPPPWLVVVADAPVRPSQTARFYLRAMRDRVAGVAHVPYLARLRTVVSAAEALEDRAVQRAGEALLHSLVAGPGSRPRPAVRRRP